MHAVIRIAVLITCFNRQQKTLDCLHQLAAQLSFSLPAPKDPAAAESVQLTVYLLDNGDDGTYEAVAATFPWVRLSRGHAELYWTSGMRLVWQQALADATAQAPYQFYLWLNDDVALAPDAVYRLLDSYLRLTPKAGALIGTVAKPSLLADAATSAVPTAALPEPSQTLSLPSYGGRQRISKLNPLAFGPVMLPTDQPQRCVFINGNICLIPQRALQAVGILSDRFSHGLGDFDYGLRLQQAGLATYIAPGFYGECSTNPKAGSILDAKVPLAKRLQMIERQNVLPPNAEWRYFVRCHGGWLWPLFWLKSWLRQLFPAVWLRLRQHRNGI
jgi:GT2 family glycosyltransferase